MAGRAVRIGFHWISVLLVGSAFAIAFYRWTLDDPDQRLFWLDWHRVIGLTLMSLTVLRVVGRKLLPVENPHEQTPMLRFLATASHTVLYAALITMPLLGWAESSAKARKFKLFGVKMPSIVRHDGDLAGTFGQWHEIIAWGLLVLIGMHAMAALYHHFVRRDEVLHNMIRLHPR